VVQDDIVPRASDLGIRIGHLPSGATGSVHDVPGVGMGHTTVMRDEPAPPSGRGTARTGVSVLLPADDLFARPLPAGGAVLNGAGECTGLLAAAEWGLLETPVFLTSTMQLGRVYDAACELLAASEPLIGQEVAIPVVAECDDSFLNDVRRMQVTRDDVAAAWRQAREVAGSGTPPDEGSVGAGTGMCCLGFKGGIGTASRVVPAGYTVGVALLANFGERERLTVAGLPVGRMLAGPGPVPSGSSRSGQRAAGSCIALVVTDAPLDGAACSRLARRVGLGLARTGSTAHHGSGEIFLACSTGVRGDRDGRLHGPPRLAGPALDPLFAAVVEASEEAVLTAMLCSATMTGRDGNRREGLPAEEVRALLHRHGLVDG
jgi:D-aminopeptidase